MNASIDISGVYLESDRLILRPWRKSDLQDLYEYARVDGVGQMAGWNPHQSIDESEMILDMFMREKNTFAIEFDGKVVGSLGIDTYSEEHYSELADFKGREIGYALSKDYWGQGLMPEAVMMVNDWLFRKIMLDFIVVGHFDWNDQSRRVIEKCGFRYIKTLKFETRYDTVENSLQHILWNPYK